MYTDVHSKDRLGEINIPNFWGGVCVHPCDLVVGDDDGVVVVPRDRMEEILKKAEEKKIYERNRLDVIAEYELNRRKGILYGNIEPKWLKEKMKLHLIGK